MHKIVFTGADDATAPESLLPLSKEYPFVEWGVLVAKNEIEEPKYPSVSWLERWLNFRDEQKKQGFDIDFSIHICNEWAEEIAFGGSGAFDKMGHILSRVPRLQLNFARFLDDKLNKEKLFALLKGKDQEFVFQLPSFSYIDLVLEARKQGIRAFAFFDPSAGQGISPSGGWPNPPSVNIPVGFAGGLGPLNLQAALNTISKLSSYELEPSVELPADHVREYWVDMETNVRTDGKFDLEKVHTCLKIAKPFYDAKP